MIAVVMVAVSAIVCCVLFEKKLHETLPVALFFVTLGVYAFALVFSLATAVIICAGVILAATAVIFGLRLFSKKDRPAGRSDIKGFFVTGPVIVCILCCVFFSLLVSGHRVIIFDDLSYWGLYTKNIFSIGKLPHLFENCTVDYKDYTPVIQILQYIALLGKSSFDETCLFRTNICLIYILMLPLLSGAFEKKSKAFTALSVAFYVIFPHILTAHFYYRLGVDLFLALVFGYALFYVFSGEENEAFRLTALVGSLSFLALIKTSGIVLCILAILMFVCKGSLTEKKKKTVIAKTALISAFASGSYLSWQLFLRLSWNNGYLSNRVKDGVGSGSFSFPEYTGEVIVNYIRHFFTYPLTRDRIGATAFVLVVFIILADRLLHREDGGRDRLYKGMLISSLTGLVIFCIAHVCMYLFVFDEWEAHGLMEYDRYITQYLGGIFYLYACLLTIKCSSKRTAGVLSVCVAAFIVLLPYGSISEYLIPSHYADMYAREYSDMAEQAQEEWDESGIDGLGLVHDGTQKLTVVGNAWDDTMQFMEYSAVPQPINRIVNVPAAEPGTLSGFIMDFVDEYVYVCRNAKDSYRGDWSETKEITDDGAELISGGLYKVDRTNDDKSLILIK